MKINAEEEKIIDEYLETERLRKNILDTSRVSWDYKIQEKDIDNWLENFDGRCLGNADRERKVALWLLAHCTYYTDRDIRALCKVLFEEYVHRKLLEQSEDVRKLQERIADILDNTLFIGLGNDSESGNSILYFFRQENGLPKKNFSIKNGNHYQNIVYIDDVTLSGSQAITYMQMHRSQADHIYVATLLATEQAIRMLSDEALAVIPICAIRLDEREKAFSEVSHLFSDKNMVGIKEIVKKLCTFYGNIVIEAYDDMAGYPLGYDNGQYLFALSYNTPNNTLPIFWGESNGWKPILKRYPKIYSGKVREIDERQYY